MDGPGDGVVSLTGLSIARDGTGGLVYLKSVGGVQHVFVSRLVGGVFQVPEEVDGGFAGPSSQPVIAAGNGGALLVAFVNSGALYVVDRLSATSGYQAPQLIAGGGASNPSIQMSNFGKAYLAFAAGANVRVAYYYNGQWQLVSAPLNATPSDGAGSGDGGPVVATAGDGIATVVWGEQGHIFSRRVWYTSPSVVFEQADVPYLAGWTELSSSQPYAAAGGNSSYVDVVFVETLGAGASQQSRVLFNQLRGSQYQGVVGNDGLGTPGTDSGADPRVAMAEYGNGLATAYQVNSGQVWSSVLTQNGFWYGMYRVDSLPNVSPPYPVPSAVGTNSLVVAWQHDPGMLLAPDIRARYFTVANGYGPEVQVSSSGQAANAAQGLATAGDVNGDVAVAWAQGSGTATAIEVAQLYQPSAAPLPRNPVSYTKNNRPTLSWTPPTNSWGPFTYTLFVGSTAVGTTTLHVVQRSLRARPGRAQLEGRRPQPRGAAELRGQLSDSGRQATADCARQCDRSSASTGDTQRQLHRPAARKCLGRGLDRHRLGRRAPLEHRGRTAQGRPRLQPREDLRDQGDRQRPRR